MDTSTLHSLIGALAAHGERPALLAFRRDGVEEWSYAALSDRVHRLANGLKRAGIGRGDRVALFAPNRPEWVAACLAGMAARAVIVPIDAQMGDSGLKHVLGDSGSRLVFTSAEGAARLARLELAPESRMILLDAGEGEPRSWKQLLQRSNELLPASKGEETAVLFYTSGTTGPPKGVALSHRNLLFQIETLTEAKLQTPEDRMLLPLPFHHVYPFVIGMLLPLSAGIPIILPQALTGAQLLRAVKEGEATIILGVPRLYRALYDGIVSRAASRGRLASLLFRASAGLSTVLRRHLGLSAGKSLLRPLHRELGPRLRVLASGGSALDPELAWKLEGLGWQVAIGYGLTETSPLLTLLAPGEGRLGSAGRPISGVELRIDPSAVPGTEEERARSPARRGEGEVLARGPGVFSGYYNLPEATREVFSDGWFRTGDLGHLDREGYLHLSGRLSTLIVTEGGKNVQPEEVEDAYAESAAIQEIAVIERQGRLAGLVVPEPGALREAGEEGIEAVVRRALAGRSKRLPSYQRLVDFAVTREPLPRTRLGKLRRHLLAERLERARLGEEERRQAPGPLPLESMSEADRALLDDPRAKAVWDWLARRYRDKPLAPDSSPQLDLGIDSLAWLDLSMEIAQRTGVELSEEAIGRIESVRDLLREVSGEGEPARRLDAGAIFDDPESLLDERARRWLEPLSPPARALARGLFALNRLLTRGLFRLQVEGRENLPAAGPYVIAPNHTSHLDALAIAAALDDRRLRQTWWAGWTGVVSKGLAARGLSRLWQAVPIDAERAAVSSLAFGAAVLRRGRSLVWFPEGQRSLSGELQPFKAGIGRLLERFPVPVVPAYIEGTREAMPPGRILPRPRPVKVTFGRPLRGAGLEQEGQGDRPAERIAAALHEHVAELGRKGTVAVH
jgi:long-chain acyl-CoA synthetase